MWHFSGGFVETWRIQPAIFECFGVLEAHMDVLGTVGGGELLDQRTCVISLSFSPPGQRVIWSKSPRDHFMLEYALPEPSLPALIFNYMPPRKFVSWIKANILCRSSSWVERIQSHHFCTDPDDPQCAAAHSGRLKKRATHGFGAINPWRQVFGRTYGTTTTPC